MGEVGVEPRSGNNRGSLGKEWAILEGKWDEKLPHQGLSGSHGHGTGSSQASCPKTGPERKCRAQHPPPWKAAWSPVVSLPLRLVLLSFCLTKA